MIVLSRDRCSLSHRSVIELVDPIRMMNGKKERLKITKARERKNIFLCSQVQPDEMKFALAPSGEIMRTFSESRGIEFIST